jgi:hypothetical protein
LTATSVRRVIVGTAFLLASLAAFALAAEEPAPGVVEGIVRLPDGSPWISNEEQWIALRGVVGGASTDSEGRFRFEGIEPGAYTLSVLCRECGMPEFPGIEVRSGESTSIELEVDDTTGLPTGPAASLAMRVERGVQLALGPAAPDLS